MKTRTKRILKILNINFWVIFIGLCINTGAIIISFFISLHNPEGARNLYKGLNLMDLRSFSLTDYSIIVSFLIILSALKAFITYLVIKIFIKINFVHPFDINVSLLITQISHVSLITGIIAVIANGYSEWLIKSGVTLNTLQLNWEGSAEFLFLAAIIYVLAQVFKRGIEIQSENELTV
jgi:hypothetical protein